MNCRIMHIGTATLLLEISSIRLVIPIHYEGWKHFQESRDKAEQQFAAAEMSETVQGLPLCASNYRNLNSVPAAGDSGESRVF